MLRRTFSDLHSLRRETRRYLVGSALMGAAFSVPWTLLNLYLDALGYSKVEIGNVQSAEAWGRGLVAIPAAFVLARRRTTPILAVTAALAGLAYAALPAMPNLLALWFLNAGRGLLDQVHHVAIAPFLFRHTSLKERAAAFGLAEAVHTLAAVVGSFGCGRAVELLEPVAGDPTRAMAWVLTATGVLPLLAALAFLGIGETVRPPEESPPVLPTLRRHRGLVARFAAPQFVIACGAGLVIPFLGLYFQERFDFEPGSVGTLYACGQVLMTTGFLASPWILRRLGFVRGIVAVELCSIPFFLVLAFSHQLPIAIAAFLLRGALMNTAHPIFKNLMMEGSPPGLRELQNGVLGLLWGVGWIVGPLLGGFILDETGGSYTVLMCATVACYLMASTLTFFLLRPVERGLERPS